MKADITFDASEVTIRPYNNSNVTVEVSEARIDEIVNGCDVDEVFEYIVGVIDADDMLKHIEVDEMVKHVGSKDLLECIDIDDIVDFMESEGYTVTKD